MGVRVARQAEAGVRTSFPAGFLQIKERERWHHLGRPPGRGKALRALGDDGRRGRKAPLIQQTTIASGPGVPRVMPSTCCTAHAT